MKSSAIQSLLQEGSQLQRQGAFDEAARRFKKVLRAEPARIEALMLLAFVLLQQHRPTDARPHAEKAQRLAPQNPAAHNLFGAVLMGCGDADAALAAFARATALDPALAGAWLSHALAALSLQRFEAALASLDRLVDLQPGHAAGHFHRGKTLLALGRRDDAVAALQQALAVQSDHAEAHLLLGDALYQAGDAAAALSHHRHAVEHAPGLAEAHLSLGNSLLALRLTEDAAGHYRQAVTLKPDLAEGHVNLANVLHELQQTEAAIRHYRHAISLRPDYVEARLNLGNVWLSLDRNAEAAEEFERVVALRPDFALGHENLGNALRRLGRTEASMAQYDKALALDPGRPHTLDNKAKLLIDLGRLDEARALLEQAIARDPDAVGQLHTISALKRFTSDDPHFAALERLAQDAGTRPVHDRIELHFALGKARKDIGDPAGSFDHLLQANALKRSEFAYDEAARLAAIGRIAGLFTRDFLAGHRGVGDPSDAPVFVVGMPRSGSTLVEQILASHPQVHGAGERTDFEHVLKETVGADALFPDHVPTMRPEQFHRLGRDYAAAMQALAPDATRIVDKMLGNFCYAGLIHLALPNARIIHTRRDPVDTCLSCFSIMFGAYLPFAYDLGELGRYYRAYRELMAHWRAVLPEGVMIDVDYEAVVDDLEGQARRIVAHCGLDWDPRCLAFHEAQRPVQTASAAQVRQPVYRSSVGRGRAYDRKLLAPLLEALDGA